MVRLVKRAQLLGFSLDEIEELLHLAAGGPDNCDTARAMANGRMDDLGRRIAELTAMRDGLSRLVDTCEMPRAERECPILQELEPAG